jgi:hypothetical protein
MDPAVLRQRLNAALTRPLCRRALEASPERLVAQLATWATRPATASASHETDRAEEAGRGSPRRAQSRMLS